MEAVSGKVKKPSKVQLHICATVFEKLDIPRRELQTTPSGITAHVLVTEEEEELKQFAVDLPKPPFPEKYADDAILKLGVRLKRLMRQKGLLK